MLNGVLIKEGVNHLNAGVSSVIEKGIKILPTSGDLIQAMSIMVMGGETVLPVEEQDTLQNGQVGRDFWRHRGHADINKQ